MIMYNEKDVVGEIIANHDKPYKMTYYKLIRYIAMYYYDEWHELRIGQYVDNVLEKMREFNFDISYQEWKFVQYTRRFCKKLISGKARHELLDIRSVNITRKEMNIIQSAETEKQQMLMFTFFVVAKISIAPSGWINYDLKDVFDLADVKLTKLNRHKMIHELYAQKLIRLNEYPDKRGYYIELQDDSNDIMMTITDFEHVGRQYLEKYKDGWKMCERCKRMIRMHAPNQKYCKKCAEIIKKDQITSWRREKAEEGLQTA